MFDSFFLSYPVRYREKKKRFGFWIYSTVPKMWFSFFHFLVFRFLRDCLRSIIYGCEFEQNVIVSGVQKTNNFRDPSTSVAIVIVFSQLLLHSRMIFRNTIENRTREKSLARPTKTVGVPTVEIFLIFKLNP